MEALAQETQERFLAEAQGNQGGSVRHEENGGVVANVYQTDAVNPGILSPETQRACAFCIALRSVDQIGQCAAGCLQAVVQGLDFHGDEVV